MESDKLCAEPTKIMLPKENMTKKMGQVRKIEYTSGIRKIGKD